ncbi:MAG: glycosyltransferase [Bacteroidales bacterium]|nr:glycosyltransferase [Bacteroidales bacterium]MDZ4203276.1 glycosyltransferase [Bacteroidales bacterium]
MKLSVVIVNYNVKYFLEQCLHSVRRAIQGIDAEVFVVDNNSVDGSVKMLEEKFPEITLIANTENKGFSKANNQAIALATGEYILLLNPDTVVEDDTFSKVIGFMDTHADAGGLGVKMIDGKGRFLLESKRGLPSPSVAFYKIFGMARLFPKSKLFGQYHLSYLDKEKTHQVDILSGAFMLLRKQALDKTGLLDETFFMYGEDIDLCYRILQAGYKNYYYPETRIIHYKGESTKKSSVNYVFTFYNAMIIFARKHFSPKNARLFSLFIHIAIWLRAGISIAWRFARNAFLPVADAVLLFTGIYFIKSYWEGTFIYLEGGQYPVEFMAIAVPIYILIWLTATYFSGGYDKPVRLIKIMQGLFFGTVTILVFYALLSETYRFSRALIMLGAVWGLVAMDGLRLLLHLTKLKDFRLGTAENKRYLVVGELEEANRVAELLRKTELNPSFIGLISMNDTIGNSNGFIGTLGQIHDIITIYNINEVIFCAKDIPARIIIDLMSELGQERVDFKIAPPESLSIIGSNSINTSGDLYMVELNSISKVNNRRNKRLFDVAASLILLVILPVALFTVKKPLGYIKNIVYVLAGKRSWVGYCPTPEDDEHRLSSIRNGVLNPTDVLRKRILSKEDNNRLNILYARNYAIGNDIRILIKGFYHTGR